MGNETLKHEGAGVIQTAADLDRVIAAAREPNGGGPGVKPQEDPRR
jgi:hypothetical protein